MIEKRDALAETSEYTCIHGLSLRLFSDSPIQRCHPLVCWFVSCPFGSTVMIWIFTDFVPGWVFFWFFFFFFLFFLCGLELPVSRLACSVSLTTTTLKGRVWLYLLFGHIAYLNMCFNLSLLSEHAFQFVFVIWTCVCYLNMCFSLPLLSEQVFIIWTCVCYLNMCFNLPSLSEDVFVIWTCVLICFCYRNTCLLLWTCVSICLCYRNMCLLSEHVF